MKKLILPKPYLSFSQYSSWLYSKDQYRSRYYENIPSVETREIIFGKKIAEMLEKKTHEYPILAKVKQGSHNEYEIKTKINGVPILAYLDSCTPKTGKIYEYKTGHKEWNQERVDNHDQLPFYAAALKSKHGKYNPLVDLFWLPTFIVPKKEIIDGIEFESKDSHDAEVKLTGELHVFKRKLSKIDVAQIEYNIQKVAKEISEDYESYLISNKKDFDF